MPASDVPHGQPFAHAVRVRQMGDGGGGGWRVDEHGVHVLVDGAGHIRGRVWPAATIGPPWLAEADEHFVGAFSTVELARKIVAAEVQRNDCA